MRFLEEKLLSLSYLEELDQILKNHVGAPEAFYSGQIGLFFHGGIKFNKQSVLDGTLSLSFSKI